jgi:hypothetical protein
MHEAPELPCVLILVLARKSIAGPAASGSKNKRAVSIEYGCNQIISGLIGRHSGATLPCTLSIAKLVRIALNIGRGSKKGKDAQTPIRSPIRVRLPAASPP